MSSCPYFFNRSPSIPRSGSVARHESCRKPWCPCTCCPHITCRSSALHSSAQLFKCNSSNTKSDDTHPHIWGRQRRHHDWYNDERRSRQILETCQKQTIHTVSSHKHWHAWVITFSIQYNFLCASLTYHLQCLNALYAKMKLFTNLDVLFMFLFASSVFTPNFYGHFQKEFSGRPAPAKEAIHTRN